MYIFYILITLVTIFAGMRNVKILSVWMIY